MPDQEIPSDAEVERMLAAAMGGLTPHELLVQNSLAETANIAERQAAIAKNRERALKLLAAIDKSQD
ncbi:MAG: hypothetical protein CVU18_06065 [Betaproteobacteria bacterium HGW-Betaproteobacteria-12]|nr:MAG: hypothetical protein CVU18_06065 [Betaproteobacteria bacterium HGW-Betaproteobacteria-12]